MEFLHFLGNTFIAGRDFNAKHTYWCSRFTSTKGKALFYAGKSLKCEFFFNGSPSYWPTDLNKLPDVINFFVTKGLSNYIEVETCLDISSDHIPVILTLSDTFISKTPSSFTKTDWNGYSDYLEEYIMLNIPLKTYDQLKKETKSFTKLLQLASRTNPLIIKKLTSTTNLSIEIKEMIRDKKKTRRNW